MAHIDSLLPHLSSYKRDVLGIPENGRFSGKERSHILPLIHERLNVFPEYRDHFYASRYSKIKFHRYFHHLNSSQALCINLFYPLIAEHHLELITQFLQLGIPSYPEALFEKVSDLENGRRRTNFDFHLRYSDGTEVFFEVKYTERQFGKAPNDLEHQTKFSATYLPLLEKVSHLAGKCRDRDFFLANYQVLRNLIHAGPKARIVFVLPYADATIAIALSESIDQLVTSAAKPWIKVAFLEDLLNYFASHWNDSRATEYFSAFRQKYLPSTVSAVPPNLTVNRTRRFMA